MTHADINDLETRDYIFKIGDRGKGIQARYDKNTDALIFPRGAFDYVWKLLNEALSQEPCTVIVSEKEPNEITEEVTLRFFKNSLKVRWHDFVIYNVEWLKKNWQMEMDIVCGVKPCDDAISRDAVLQAVSEGCQEWRGLYGRCEELINALPSVNATQHTSNASKDVEQRTNTLGDAVSREAVMKIVDEEWICNADYDFRSLVEALEQLPSVTQKSETVTEFADRCRECGAKYGKLLEQKSGK